MPIENCNLETLKAVLEGLDILLAQKVQTSRCKLRELSWRDLRIQAGSNDGEGLAEFMTEKQPTENSPECEVKTELKVMTELFVMGRLDESTTYLLQWAQQRKDSIHLFCRKLVIEGLTKATVIEIFKTVHADCIQELMLSSICIEELAFLNTYLRQMKSLFALTLNHIIGTFSLGDSEKLDEETIFSLISELPTLHCLQKLYINDVPFIKGILKEYLRCLKKPLDTLCISNCDFSQSDLDYLPYCLNICELKHLQLRDIYLCDLLLEPFGFLLERVGDTLQTLELESCCIVDSQFSVLLPALSQCSQLREVNFYDNYVSLPFLKQLLHHTAQLSQLIHERYPVPLECYDDSGVILTHRLENFCPELLDILRAKRQLRSVAFETRQCSKCGGYYIYNLETQCCLFVELL